MGGELRRCRFPIIGSCGGPGGSFEEQPVELFHFLWMKKKMMKIDGKMRSAVVDKFHGDGVSIFSLSVSPLFAAASDAIRYKQCRAQSFLITAFYFCRDDG